MFASRSSPRPTRRAAACAAVALLAVGCSSEAPEDPVYSADPSAGALLVETGVGYVDFIPVSDGDRVQVVMGPQGGYHIWTAIRVRAPALETVQVTFSTRFASNGKEAGWPSRRMLKLPPQQDGRQDGAGLPNLVSDPNAVRDQRIVLRAEVIASDGRSGSAECVVVPE